MTHTDSTSKERWWLFRLQCNFKSFGSNQSNRLKKDYRGRDPRTIQSADRSIRVSPRFSLFFGTGPARSFWFWVGPGPKRLNISYFSVVDLVLDRSVLVLGSMVEDVHDNDYVYSLIYSPYIDFDITFYILDRSLRFVGPRICKKRCWAYPRTRDPRTRIDRFRTT